MPWLEPGGAGWAKGNKSMRRNKLLPLKPWMLLRKHAVFLPVHPKCKSLKPEILSVSYNFRDLRGLKAAVQMSWPLGGDTRECGEGGLAQVAVDAKEETTGRASGFFSRIILPFEAGSYSLCDAQENSSGISTDYFCIQPNSQQQRTCLSRGFTYNTEKALSWASC